MAWKAAEHTAWGRALRSPSRIARPERQSVLHDIMASTPAPAIGAARSYGDAALNDGGHLIDMTRLDRLLEFNAETGRVRAEAGVRLSDLLQIFGPQGWMPAVLPGTAFVTVGGAIARHPQFCIWRAGLYGGYWSSSARNSPRARSHSLTNCAKVSRVMPPPETRYWSRNGSLSSSR